MAQPWSKTSSQVLNEVNSDAVAGLSASQARQRLEQVGPNRLAKPRQVTFGGIFWEEIREPMILLLLVVAVVYIIWGEKRDAITILVVITALVLAEIFTEYRAKKAIVALRRLAPSTTAVQRDGVYVRVPTEEIVSGDIIMLEVGFQPMPG
jgi:Ca2+-transporting ATPase